MIRAWKGWQWTTSVCLHCGVRECTHKEGSSCSQVKDTNKSYSLDLFSSRCVWEDFQLMTSFTENMAGQQTVQILAIWTEINEWKLMVGKSWNTRTYRSQDSQVGTFSVSNFKLTSAAKMALNVIRVNIVHWAIPLCMGVSAYPSECNQG